jgi:hypothetical protein
MVDEIPGPVTGVQDEDLAAVVSHISALPSSEEGDAERFAREVRGVVEKRAQLGWPEEGDHHDVAAFVLVEYPRQIAQRFRGIRVLDLNATQVRLLGRVFFLSRDASNGAAIEFPTQNPAEVLDWLADQGLGECTVILVYRTRKLMVSRRAGVSSEAQQDPIRDTPPLASFPELLEALRFFHRNKLLIPSLCPDGVWEAGRASQYIPGRRPEKCIQKELTGALNFWFRGVVRAEMEDSTSIGRIDVRLLRTDQGPLYYWAIVELKVIKSKRNAPARKKASAVNVSENADAVAEGVLQAHAYRANRQAEEGLLEVYDLRLDKSLDMFGHATVQKAMARCNPVPVYNTRPIFGEASHARAAGLV